MISRRSFIKFLGAAACCALPFIRHIGGNPSDIKPVSAPKTTPIEPAYIILPDPFPSTHRWRRVEILNENWIGRVEGVTR